MSKKKTPKKPRKNNGPLKIDMPFDDALRLIATTPKPKKSGDKK